MLSIDLESDLEEQLTALAKEHNKSKELFIKELIISFLEDQEDITMAIEAMENRDKTASKGHCWEEIKKQNGL